MNSPSNDTPDPHHRDTDTVDAGDEVTPPATSSGIEPGVIRGGGTDTDHPRDNADSDTTTSRPREIGGQAGPEPTRYGDWEKKGRCTDF